MHTVHLLEQALEVASQLGYQIRHEWLGGNGGGACEFLGKKWIFVDLSLNAIEQLDQVESALREDPGLHVIDLPDEFRAHLGLPKAA